MVHIYYHIYAIDGVDTIIDEQLSLIKKHFDFPYTLNVGISIANDNTPITNILNKFDKVRDVRARGHEFTTLDLLEKDKEKFGDSDYILYIHTKGASKLNNPNYDNIKSWRELMNYFNIEKCKNVFKIFEKTEYNTFGVLFCKVKENEIYGGNFWWAKSSYLKTLNMKNVDKNRNNAEWSFIQNGKNWKPYSPYNLKHINYYYTKFDRNEYEK